ncbi:MAG: DUF3341 domain-containing protein [Bacteroidia bacterium]|jgi:hypothetical protein|nr:DUF3341 domain-containing protein [Bacteroidia bacterium]MCO5253075.1 DUF3341 domain-containing protein [Bacteroidota bacterium]
MIDKKLSLRNSKNLLFGIFEDGDAALDATRTVYGKGVNIIDCYSPYPIHGMEKAMGLKRSRLPIGAFIAAMTGLSLAIILQAGIMFFDWPMIIGGKPYAGIPSWVPVMFELSILCTAFGIVILFFIRSAMIHGKIPNEVIDPRQTNDRIILALSLDEEGINKDELVKLLYERGAVTIKERMNLDNNEFEDKVINNG